MIYAVLFCSVTVQLENFSTNQVEWAELSIVENYSHSRKSTVIQSELSRADVGDVEKWSGAQRLNSCERAQRKSKRPSVTSTVPLFTAWKGARNYGEFTAAKVPLYTAAFFLLGETTFQLVNQKAKDD